MNTDILEQYIESGNLQGLSTLLDSDITLAKCVTSQKVSPIMLACYYRKTEVMALLIKYLNDSLNLFEASAAGKFDVAAHLIYTHPEQINTFSNDGFTPLGLACYFGHTEIAKFLVLKGADVNLSSKNGFNVHPIHSAVAANQNEIVNMLIENGANVNMKQQSGVTPLHTAAQNGNLEIIIMLLENGADITTRMEGGKLPADLAKEKGFDAIAEILEN